MAYDIILGNNISQIGLHIEVLPGPTPEAAFNAARNLQATSVILDRSVSNSKLFSLVYEMEVKPKDS